MKANALTQRLILFALTLGTMGYGFWGMFHRAADVFGDHHEDMSFGWYVPVFSLYILWTERAALKRALGAPSLAGFLASLPFLALALLGTRGLQLRFEQLGFIGLCVTIPWAFFGRKVAKICLFPAAYLIFTIPVTAFLDFFTIRLRMLASSTALGVMRGLGFDVVQQGTALVSQQGAAAFQIDVAEPCSGLRSFFALTALTAAYAWFSQPTWGRRLALFLASGPLAILGNVVRIISICLVAAYADADFALGFYHDYSGYIVFIVAISCMVAVGEAITRLATLGKVPARKVAPPPSDLPAAPPQATASAGRGLIPALLFCAVFVFQAQTPRGHVMPAPEVRLPAAVPGFVTERVRHCQNEQCGRLFSESELLPDLPEAARPAAALPTNCPTCGSALDIASLGERRILPGDTDFKRLRYRDARGRMFLVSAVIGGKSKQSIHRPELCLPTQGYLLSDPENVTINNRPFHTIRLTPPDGVPALMAYTFFNQNGFRTASHVRRILTDVWDRSVYNRVDRWVMVTAHVFAPQGVTLARAPDRLYVEDFLRRLSEELP